MSTREFLLPDLGEGLTESDVVSWRVAVGDTVALNQVIAEVETAKALVELPSPVAGVVARLHAEPGMTVPVGAPLVTFEVPDGATGSPDAGPAPTAGNAAEPAPAPAAEPVSEPHAVGSRPAGPRGARGSDEEGDREEAPAPDLVGYGARAERSGRPARRPRREPAHPAARPPVAPGRVRATPPVRVLARREGVDLASVAGTGPDGAVTRDDVAAAARGDDHPSRPESRERVQGVRRRTAEAMVASAFTAPQATVWTSVDATATVELLARLADDREAVGIRLTVLAAVARATCLALRRHPDLNASWRGDEIVRFGYVDLGIAVATERGLVVPHVPDADGLGMLDLARALGELAAETRAGRTGLARLTGGTFTITNVGVFDVDGGTPILNPGQAGILAVGAVRRRPWEHDGAMALRDVVTLAVSFDHRVADGEQAARFLADVGALLTDPGRALLHGDGDRG